MKEYNIMISNGLKGKENPKEYVTKCRDALEKWCRNKGICYNLLHSYRPDEFESAVATMGEVNARIAMLGITTTNELAICDILVLVDDWYNYNGCCIEFEIARRYGKRIEFISTEV